MSYQKKSMKFVANLFITHIIISLISSVQLDCKGAPASARVKSFPGYHGNISYEIYAGYVTVSEVNGREIFYYFVESERNPSKDPLLLWLIGGPGCTGFTGFAYELGPMSFDLNNNSGNLPTLIPNPHSWTKVSNIIFIDSPVGTGFSYSNTSTDYVTGDFKTVADIHTFLIKGYLVGNGFTDEVFDNAQVPFAHGKGLISDELYQAVKETCYSSYLYSTNASCQSNLLAVLKDLNGINKGNIIDPVCYPLSKKQENLSSQKILTKRYEKLEVSDQPLGSRRRLSSHGWFTKSLEDGFLTVQLQLGYQDRPCPTVDKYQLSNIWANNPYVRKAIHAQSEITGEWKRCTDRFKYNYDFRSVVEYHRDLTRKGYRALIYSGDQDLIVPFIGTEAWIRSLNYTIFL